MFEFILVFILTAMALANLTNILTESDPLEYVRLKFQLRFPTLGKLASCKYCQSFWLSGCAGLLSVYYAWPIVATGMPPLFQFVITWFALHLTIYFIHSRYDRIASDAPIPLYVMLNNTESEKSSESERPDSSLN